MNNENRYCLIYKSRKNQKMKERYRYYKISASTIIWHNDTILVVVSISGPTTLTIKICWWQNVWPCIYNHYSKNSLVATHYDICWTTVSTCQTSRENILFYDAFIVLVVFLTTVSREFYRSSYNIITKKIYVYTAVFLFAKCMRYQLEYQSR